MSLCLDRSELSERLAASRAVSKDGRASVFGSVPFLSLCPTYSLHIGPASRESWANPYEPRTCWPDLDNRLGQATLTGGQAEPGTHTDMNVHSPVQHGQSMGTCPLDHDILLCVTVFHLWRKMSHFKISSHIALLFYGADFFCLVNKKKNWVLATVEVSTCNKKYTRKKKNHIAVC